MVCSAEDSWLKVIVNDIFSAILAFFLLFFFFFSYFSRGWSNHKVSLVVNACLEILSPNTHAHIKGSIKPY